MNCEISRLLATGQAQSSVYTTITPNSILTLPKSGKGIIIHKITVKAFADLPAGALFSSFPDVDFHAWHQLRIINAKGTQVFNFKWDLNHNEDNLTGETVLLPSGELTREIWFNSETDVILEWSGIKNLRVAWNNTIGAMPDIAQLNYNAPPFGFGKTNQPGNVATVSRVSDVISPIPNAFEFRAFGETLPPLIPNSKTNFEWPLTTQTALNPGQPNIAYGQFTMPNLQVDYIIYNKAPTANFAPPL